MTKIAIEACKKVSKCNAKTTIMIRAKMVGLATKCTITTINTQSATRLISNMDAYAKEISNGKSLMMAFFKKGLGGELGNDFESLLNPTIFFRAF